MKPFFKLKRALPKENKNEIRVQKPKNPYYESVSDRFGIAQVLLFLSLLAFVSVFLLSNTGLITYQNLYYLIRDLNASAENVDVLHTDAVSYAADTAQSFTLYRKGLAVAGNGSVTVFTASGRQSIGQSIRYRNPVAVGTGKYLLVYELGGTQYSLYNSYTQIYTGKTSVPICNAAVSPSGSYAIVTVSSTEPSVVEFYDSEFSMTNRNTYPALVTDVAISEKGDRLAVLFSDTEDAAYATTVRFYEPRKADPVASLSFGQGLGLSCAFTARGNLAVLSSDGVYYSDLYGKLIAEYLFDGRGIVAADVNDGGCGVVLQTRGTTQENEVLFFDGDGRMLLRETVSAGVDSVAVTSGAVFLKYSDRLMRIRTDTAERSEILCHTEGKTLLAVETDRVALCASQKTVFYRFT